jgi:hypothetical protein
MIDMLNNLQVVTNENRASKRRGITGREREREKPPLENI